MAWSEYEVADAVIERGFLLLLRGQRMEQVECFVVLAGQYPDGLAIRRIDRRFARRSMSGSWRLLRQR